MGIKLYMDDARPCPEGWVLARTVFEAKLHLTLGGVDELSLDHDMGVCDECNKDPLSGAANVLRCEHVPCGMDLVNWIIEHKRWPKTKPVVHSANPWGARRMREAIEQNWPCN